MDALIIYKLYIKNPDQKNTKNHQYTTYIDDFYYSGIHKKYDSSEIPIFSWMLCEMLEHQPSSY